MKTKIILAALLAFNAGVSYGQKVDFASTIKIDDGDSRSLIIEKAAHVVPTANQLKALEREFIAFIHFGPNSFTGKEWGNGFEEPSVFAPTGLDTDQWCEAMKAAGMKMVILTAKHHDGFVLWQSRYTKHGIMSSPLFGGKGDIMKDLSASCKKYGLKLGVYISPADLYQIESPEGLYGNLSKSSMRTIPKQIEGRAFRNKTTFKFEVDDYNEYFLSQLFELLTEYGPVDEVWFDGAHPKTKGGQTYNYAAWKELIHTLAPRAVIFGREDIRWCGNEAGATRQTEWNVIPYQENPQTATRFHDMTDKDLGGEERLLGAKYLHYQQAETNTSIREGWFYRDDTRQSVRSADDVFDIYERSVGGNSTFLLNIPPNREGRFSPTDVEVLKEVGMRIGETYGKNLFEMSQRAQIPDSVIVLTAKKPVRFNRVMLQEAIATNGERVAQHSLDAWVDGRWEEVAVATNIGYKRILRFPEVTTDRLRLRILSSRLKPEITTFSAHYYRSQPPQLTIARNAQGKVDISTKNDSFAWKSHGQNASENLNQGFEIYYTTDSSTPTAVEGKHYQGPFDFECGELRAVAVVGQQSGAVAREVIGLDKKMWTVDTYQTGVITVNLGETKPLAGFSYTPTIGQSQQMRVSGIVEFSNDGLGWANGHKFEFANLTNDPTTRYDYFTLPVEARYVRFVPAKGVVINVNNLEIY